MNSHLEKLRSGHEGLERLEEQLVQEMDREVKSYKRGVYKAHVMAGLVEDEMKKAGQLVALHSDGEAMEREKAVLEGAEAGGDPVVAFYEALKEVKDFYRAYPAEVLEDVSAIPPTKDRYAGVGVVFSGEEQYGKYVDLVALHTRYLNVKAIPVKAMQYLEYLDVLALSLFDTPVQSKPGNADYKGYIDELARYLWDFAVRTDPMRDMDAFDSETQTAFDAAWASDSLPGEWARVVWTHSDSNELYCGPCDRVLAKLALLASHANGKKHKKALKRYTPGAPSKRLQELRQIAAVEMQIDALVKLLGSHIRATKINVERKQARTAQELVADMAVSDDGFDPDDSDDGDMIESEDEDEMQLYNPLNIPVGPDGKRMAYWLFKLQGLDQHFTCEICGNKQYRGRLEFEQHFQRQQHAHGMRCLGIPNTKAFQGITLIADAKALWASIRGLDASVSSSSAAAAAAAAPAADAEEEVEDAQGRVMSRRTFELMRANGLL